VECSLHDHPEAGKHFCDFHRYSIYVTALYFLISNSTTVGYGDYFGKTIYERLFLWVI